MKRLKSFLIIALACIFLSSSLGVSAAPVSIAIENEDTQLGYITDLKCDVVANAVTVSGTAEVGASSVATVTFWIKQNTTDKDLLFWQHTTGANGKFKLRFILDTNRYDTAQGATATLKVGGLGLNTYSKSDITLYSQTQIDACKADYMSIGQSGGKTFAEFFNAHKDMLGITVGYSDEDFEIIERYHTPATGSETNDEIVAAVVGLNDKLTAHKALVANISTAAQGADITALSRLFDVATGAANISLLTEYYGGEAEYNNAFSLNAVALTDAFWARLINSQNSYTTIGGFETAFVAARTAQMNDETDCANYFKTIDGTTNTSQQFFATYGSLIGTTVTESADLAIFDKYYNESLLAGDIATATTVLQVIELVETLVDKLDRHKALVANVSAAAQGTDSDRIRDYLTDSDDDDLTGFVTLEGIINPVALWARMLKADGYSSLDEIEAAFVAAYTAQLEYEDSYGGPVTSNRAKDFLDQWTISNVANLITIKGAHPDTASSNVTYHIAGKEGGISSTEPAKTIMITQGKTYRKSTNASNSVFEISFPLNTARFGAETTGVFRISADNTNTHQFFITLYPQTRVDSLISEFASIDNATELKTFIDGDGGSNAGYADMLAVSGGYSDGKIAVMLELYNENKSEMQSATDSVVVAEKFTELEAGTTEVLNFIEDLNTAASAQPANWAQMQQLISTTYKNKGLDEISDTYAGLYTTAAADNTDLDLDVIALYEGMLGQTYTTVADVVSAYNTSKNALPAPGQGGTGDGTGDGTGEGTGDGTGDGTGTGTGKGDVGGGGGNTADFEIGDGFIVEDLTPEIPADELPVGPFKDLSGYSWAQTAINNLRQRGIIRGDGDNKFRPGANMTREEFLSVLLKTFSIEIEAGDISFSDVNPNEWYADVVATAYKIGITNGIGGNRFGIGQNITRSDMVVMAARLAASRGVNIAQKEAAVIFEDYTAIPDYAYEAVVAFQQADFINGDDKGYFNPANATTRAEAAVFFWSIFDYMN